MTRALLLLCLCSCAALDRARAGTPDLTTPSGPGIYWHGVAPVAGVAARVELIHAAAVAVCPPARLSALDAAWHDAVIEWEPTDPFDCYGREVHGCNPLRSTVWVASSVVLADELGHVVWQACDGRSGEVTQPDGSIVYDADFRAWVQALEAP